MHIANRNLRVCSQCPAITFHKVVDKTIDTALVHQRVCGKLAPFVLLQTSRWSVRNDRFFCSMWEVVAPIVAGEHGMTADWDTGKGNVDQTRARESE